MKKIYFILMICAIFCAGALLAGCSDSLEISTGSKGGSSSSSSGSTPSISDSDSGTSSSLSGTTWTDTSRGVTLRFSQSTVSQNGLATYRYTYNDGRGTISEQSTGTSLGTFTVSGSRLTWKIMGTSTLTFYKD